MGVSTDAILFWGFSGGEDEEGESWYRAELREDWEAVYADKVGMCPPDAAYDPANSEVWRGYWREKRAVIAAGGVEIDQHCSSEHPIPFVAITASVIRASRGQMKPVAPLAAGGDWAEKLRAFCDLLGIPWQEPSWWLASYWG
jgi:hypothetical protein